LHPMPLYYLAPALRSQLMKYRAQKFPGLPVQRLFATFRDKHHMIFAVSS
jgi:hypothetical protein